MNRYPVVTCEVCGTQYNPIKNNEERPECPGAGCSAPVPAYSSYSSQLKPVETVTDDVESEPAVEAAADDEPEPEDE